MKLDLRRILDAIHDLLIFFYYRLELILEIVDLSFVVLTRVLLVIMVELIIMYIAIYKYEKLKLILNPIIEILEDWYLYGFLKLLYLIYVYIVINLLQVLIICTILILP